MKIITKSCLVIATALLVSLAGKSLEAEAMQICNDTEFKTWIALGNRYPRGTGTSTEADIQMMRPNYYLNAWYPIDPGRCANTEDGVFVYAYAEDSQYTTGIIRGRELVACLSRNEAYRMEGRYWSRQCQGDEQPFTLVPVPIPQAGQILKISLHPQNFLDLSVNYDERSNYFNYSEAAEHLRWCVQHEGVRVFDDSLPGRYRDFSLVRNECINEQAHNSAAQLQLRMLSDNSLMSLLGWIDEITRNGSFNDHFTWAVRKIGVEKVRRYVASDNYEGLRWEYHQVQGHNPDAQNLHAGVSNGYIRWLARQY